MTVLREEYEQMNDCVMKSVSEICLVTDNSDSKFESNHNIGEITVVK